MTIGIKFVPYGFFLFLLFVCCSTTYLYLAFTVNLFGLLSGSFGFLWGSLPSLRVLKGLVISFFWVFVFDVYCFFDLISLNLLVFGPFVLGLAGLLMAVDFVRNVLSQAS